jgi:hypothetical protein
MTVAAERCRDLLEELRRRTEGTAAGAGLVHASNEVRRLALETWTEGFAAGLLFELLRPPETHPSDAELHDEFYTARQLAKLTEVRERLGLTDPARMLGEALEWLGEAGHLHRLVQHLESRPGEG